MDELDQTQIAVDRSRIEVDRAHIVETQARAIAHLARLEKFDINTIIKAVVADDLTLLNRLSEN